MERAGKLEILFEDDWIVAVNKPSGLLSVGFPGYRGKTAEDMLKERYRSHGKVHVYAVHRLDRDTSGVMLFAKSAEARDRFMDGWQEIVSERTYRCVCRRSERAKELAETGTIDEPIAYNVKNVGFVPRKDDERARADAERAVTRFKVLQRGERTDLVECELETGRKNQIRVHMSHLGHPIMGDDVYGTPEDRAGSGKAGGSGSGRSGGSGNSRAGGTRNGSGRGSSRAGSLGRLALHARVIAFAHPFTGDVHRFEVSEPKEFAKAVQRDARRETGETDAGGQGGRPTGRFAHTDTGVAPGRGTGGKTSRRGEADRVSASKTSRRGETRDRDDWNDSPERETGGQPERSGQPGRKGRSSQTGRSGRFANGSKFIPGK